MSGEVELGSRARLSAHTLRDHLLNPVCRTSDEVPWCAEALTPEWLTRVLCDKTPGAAISRVTVSTASTGSSVRKRILVTYNTAGTVAGLVTRFFAKTTPDVLTRLTSGTSAGQEARFFTELAPLLPIELPAHRRSSFDRVSGRSLHLFEDLVETRAAQFCDYRTTFTHRQIEAALETLACLHGTLHGDARLVTQFSWIPRYETFFSALAATGTRAGHEQAMEEARHLIPPAVYAARDRLWLAAEDSLADHAEGPRSVIHSDVHPGNWYLTAEGRPGLCDWQCIAQGHWSRDLAYALSSMLDPLSRRQWEQDLLARYLQALAAAGGPDIPLETAWHHYRRQLPAALLMWTPTLCHPPTMPDMQPAVVSLEMIRRITAAIDDLGVPT